MVLIGLHVASDARRIFKLEAHKRHRSRQDCRMAVCGAYVQIKVVYIFHSMPWAKCRLSCLRHLSAQCGFMAWHRATDVFAACLRKGVVNVASLQKSCRN